MLLSDLNETQSYGRLPPASIKPAIEWLESNGEDWAAAMGNKRIIRSEYHDTHLYGLIDVDSNIIAFASFKDKNINGIAFYELLVISNVGTEGGNYFPMMSLLFSIKEYVGKPIIDYGAQSTQGIRFLKALDKHGHFDIFWYNTKTQEKTKYDGVSDREDLSPYRSVQQTDWKIIVENTEDGKEEFPMEGLLPFGTPQDWFNEDYSKWVSKYPKH